jgi:uncharacterized protein (TIGR00297 family)
VLPVHGKGIYRNRESRWDVGIVSYPLVVLLLILIFRRDLAIAAAAWGMLALGDPAAALAGRSLRGPRLPWNPDKTWAGLAACLVAGGAAGLLLFRFVAREAPPAWPVAVLAGAVTFALLESVRAGIEDNLVAPLPAALVIAGMLSGGAGAWLRLWTTPDFLGDLAIAAGVNAAVALLTWSLRGVTAGGAVAGFLIGSLILALGGWAAYAVLWTFFLAGTLATKLGYRIKAARGVAQVRGGRRGAAHAVANCAVAAGILVAAAGYRPFYPDLLLAGFAGAFAAALSDTLATEVGGLYGRRPFSPLRLEPLSPGTAGAVSWPGLLAAVGGAGLVAVAAGVTGLIPPPLPWAVAAAGFSGSFAESAVNDLARRQGWSLDHELANGFNTFVGAMTAMAISALLRQSPLFIPVDST